MPIKLLMKKKILIISFAYPPSTLVASYRPLSWARGLSEGGFEPTVLTRHWNGSEKKSKEIEKSNLLSTSIDIKDGIRTIRLPYNNENYIAHLQKSFVKKIKNTILNVIDYSTSLNPYNFAEIKNFLKSHLEEETYVYVIVTTPPMQYLKLGYWIQKNYKIPFWADFRDYLYLFDTIANTLSKASNVEKFIKKIQVKQTRKYLSAATVLSSVSYPIMDDLKIKTPIKKVQILNGYNKEDFIFDNEVNPPIGMFTISLLGTIYEKQNINFMLEAFNLFIKDKKEYVQINFVGTGSDEIIKKKILDNLSYKNLSITGWQPKNKATECLKYSHVLYYIGWENLKGIYSGKIFEYLGAKRNILVGPSDKDVVEKLINDTKSGKAVSSVKEMVLVLNNWYREWELNGFIDYKGDAEKIDFYTRRSQAKIVAQILNEII